MPILPHPLSNPISTFNPQVHPFTLSSHIHFNHHINLLKHHIFTTLIKTKQPITYSNLPKILQAEHPE
ncbi:hypothetical protein, partial [Paenibacillus xylanexedens]|uniref:hypothetical protein n=1 Tax=Paenibacillus xylanexedens TaxID=528191 RepID=UPI0034D96DC0